MTDRMGPIADENDISAAIEDALREAVKYRERSDGRIVQVARRAREMAVELSDSAFATALRSMLDKVGTNREAGCEVMVLAEQFAHLTGVKNFSRKTHSLIAEMRKNIPDPQQLDEASGSPGLHAAFRAYVLALARAVGMSVTVRDLSREKLLRKYEPMLWLDLATECFGPDAYVDSVRSLLEVDAFSPFKLVRRLPMIVRHQGVSIAQEVLDAACHHLYGRGRYADAWSLVLQAEDFESRGWRLPLSGGAVDVSGLRTAGDYIDALLYGPLEFSNADAIQIIERFRKHMTSHLALIYDDRGECGRREEEEERRMRLRKEIFRKLIGYGDHEKILMTMVRPEFRHVDNYGCDWWQDFPPDSIDWNIGKEDFQNAIHIHGGGKMGKTVDPKDNEVIDSSSPVPLMTTRQANSDQLGDALRSNAEAAGF